MAYGSYWGGHPHKMPWRLNYGDKHQEIATPGSRRQFKKESNKLRRRWNREVLEEGLAAYGDRDQPR